MDSEQLRGWVRLEASQPARPALEFDYMSWKGGSLGLVACLGEVWPSPNSERSNFSFSLVFVVLLCYVVFLPKMLFLSHFGFLA